MENSNSIKKNSNYNRFRKSGKKKNLRGGHFGEILDELLNKICFPLRFCINSAYVNGKPCLYISISNRYDL